VRASRAAHAVVATPGRKRTVGLSVVGVIAILLAVVSGALAAGSKGGSVRLFGTPKGSGGAFMFTGAIGDYGSTQRQNANGSPNANGNFVRFRLHHGTFVADATGFFNALNHAKGSFDKATCSGSFGATGPATLSDGTGQYAGISGSLKVTGTFAQVGPRLKNGKCSESQNAKPLSQFNAVTATGHVSFG
jgi:hypothetical protein